MKLARYTVFDCLNYSSSFSNDDFSTFKFDQGGWLRVGHRATKSCPVRKPEALEHSDYELCYIETGRIWMKALKPKGNIIALKQKREGDEM